MKSILLKVMIFLSFILLALFILSTHYVGIGECAAIVYYKPLTITDRCIFIVIALVGMLVSLLICKQKKKGIFILGSIYFVITLGLCVYGNQLLERRTIYWPHEYNPKPINNDDIVIYTDKDLMGCWERVSYKASSDSVTFLSPLIEFMDDNMFANGDTLFYYTYHLHHDTLTIHRPNNTLQEYKVLGLTKNDFTVKLLSHEIFVYQPSDISDSVTLHYKRTADTDVAQKALSRSDL